MSLLKINNTNPPQTIDKFILCECGSEGLLLTKIIDDDEDSIYLSIYRFGTYNSKPSIIERIKYCYWHLTTGKIYSDQMILTFDKAKRISFWLSENAK